MIKNICFNCKYYMQDPFENNLGICTYTKYIIGSDNFYHLIEPNDINHDCSNNVLQKRHAVKITIQKLYDWLKNNASTLQIKI